MRERTVRRIARLLALLTLLAAGSAVSCAQGEGEDRTRSDAGTAPPGEAETRDEAAEALDALGPVDWGGGDFGILYLDGYAGEVRGERDSTATGTAQVINDAVYTRNSLFEERCRLRLNLIPKSADMIRTEARKQVQAPTGEIQWLDAPLYITTEMATDALLYDYVRLGVNLDQPWWDSGTADFALAGGIYFMNGALNFVDDDRTYVIIFNKEMRETRAATIPDPYQTVRDGAWTLDHFRSIIQDVSSDNGDDHWDEEDTYGFVTTWEYGNTLFVGSDLRYILNGRDAEEPTLFLSEKSRMDKALDVLDKARRIYHEKHATFMSPPGEEPKGVNAFKEDRALFFGDVAGYLGGFNSSMRKDYGVLPVPKYDQAQRLYRTWSHDNGSTFSVTAATPAASAERVGKILDVYAILSYQHVKPAYYDTMLTTRNVRDPESAAMLDLVFQNRVYDMALYFQGFNFYPLFKSSVNADNDSFSSGYRRVSRQFGLVLKKTLNKLSAGA